MCPRRRGVRGQRRSRHHRVNGCRNYLLVAADEQGLGAAVAARPASGAADVREQVPDVVEGVVGMIGLAAGVAMAASTPKNTSCDASNGDGTMGGDMGAIGAGTACAVSDGLSQSMHEAFAYGLAVGGGLAIVGGGVMIALGSRTPDASSRTANARPVFTLGPARAGLRWRF